MGGSNEWKEKASLILNIPITFNHTCKLVFTQMGNSKFLISHRITYQDLSTMQINLNMYSPKFIQLYIIQKLSF